MKKVFAIILLALCIVAPSAMAEGRKGFRNSISHDENVKKQNFSSRVTTAKTAKNSFKNNKAAAKREAQETATIKIMLRRNSNAFNGFNLSSSLDEIRAESDRVRIARMNLSLSKATSAEEIAKLTAAHEAYWAKLAQNRLDRENNTLNANINHGLMMILKNQALLDKGIGL